MGKPTGFMEYTRELPADRSHPGAHQDWDEFHLHMQRREAAHPGGTLHGLRHALLPHRRLISGMATGCPVNNLIPEWNDLVYRGLWRQALDRLHKTNNFPEFTGRVCPAPCEGACVLAIIDPPVTIKNIESASSNAASKKAGSCRSRRPAAPARRSRWSAPALPASPAPPSSTRPARGDGLRARRPLGGLLMYGIPNMKLDKTGRPAPGRSAGRRGGPVPAPGWRSAASFPCRNCWRSSMPSSSAAAPPGRATCPSPAASLRASISPWTS